MKNNIKKFSTKEPVEQEVMNKAVEHDKYLYLLSALCLVYFQRLNSFRAV